MTAVTINVSRDRFIFQRFVADALGHLIGSYLSVVLTSGIDPHSDRPRAFNHSFALAVAGSFILCDFLAARFFGNRKWFGLAALFGASTAGILLFMICAQIYFTAIEAEGPTFSVSYVFGAIVVMFVFFLPPALICPLISRQMAYPIIAVFTPDKIG